MPGVFITTKARNDLDSIWDYISNDNLDAADNLIDQLWFRFQRLANNRLLGELQPLLANGTYRRHVFGNYVIYYDPNQDDLAIIRVIHAALDLQSQFR